jgi:hypothetical protein
MWVSINVTVRAPWEYAEPASSAPGIPRTVFSEVAPGPEARILASLLRASMRFACA